MQIQKMFKRNINRYIQGVIHVGEEDTVKQELEEYVVTRELQRHFSDFYDAYERGLDDPARNTGVWVQGYFGSGKSHFVKMLSYLLENREVDGKRAVDYFDGKFEDEMVYAKICRAAGVTAETILFNIDEKGAGYKEGETADTAVLRSFARVFYEHLGFYGRDYKLARFEKMIDDRGKTAEFRAAYEDITGTPWIEDRESYDMFGEEVAQAANRAVGLSVKSVSDWADSTDNVTVDVGELVSDIDEYAKRREAECGGRFRLLFMADEMGQYLSEGSSLNTSRMLNLQTLIEQFCERCDGRVWMVVTSQEAIDEMMAVVNTDFSKIQGRFTTRLSLSSSSVDEVIKKRVLDKTDSAALELEDEYQRKSPVLKNLFSFEGSRGDLKGYATECEFVESYPFVGYQFTLMPDVLKEIRKHGYQGKSLSTGERSMLSCYQEATMAIEDGDETCLVPFWRFYDTLEKELDHGIKQLFDRARKAAESGYVIEERDILVLKILYLINYITDVKPTVGNISILMVDHVDVDMKILKDSVKESLDRLVHENYVARNGETYRFLTDEEQDVAREINAVDVDPAQVVDEIKRIIFDKIYTSRKYRKGPNDYPFDRYVDGTIHGQAQNGMRLNVVTMADPELSEAPDTVLDLKSGGQALVVLDPDSAYYDTLYNAAKISRYVKTQNVQALPKTKRDIIMGKNDEANNCRREAEKMIGDAIVKARVSVDGRMVAVPAANASQKLGGVLDELVGVTFTKAGLVDSPIESDGQLRGILLGNYQKGLPGAGGANEDAADEMDRYLAAQQRLHQPTTMGDVQRNFQAKPYGWREIDVAAVAAKLIEEQRATLSYHGARIAASDQRMPGLLRKQSEVDKVAINKRQAMPTAITSKSRALLRELDGSASAPQDEDGLVAAVKGCLEERADKYSEMLSEKYRGGSKYPGRDQVERAVMLAKAVLSQQADPEAMLRKFNSCEDDLLDNAEDLESVESFFKTSQKDFFDEAVALSDKMRDERAYVEGDADVLDALAEIRQIVGAPSPFNEIYKLPGLCKTVEGIYGKLVSDKRDDTLRSLQTAKGEIESYASHESEANGANVSLVLRDAGLEEARKRGQIHAAQTCSSLDSLVMQIRAWLESTLRKVDNAVAEELASRKAPKRRSGDGHAAEPPAKPKTKVVSRSSVLPPQVLHNEAEVDAYLSAAKGRLMDALEGSDGVRVGQ